MIACEELRTLLNDGTSSLVSYTLHELDSAGATGALRLPCRPHASSRRADDVASYNADVCITELLESSNGMVVCFRETTISSGFHKSAEWPRVGGQVSQECTVVTRHVCLHAFQERFRRVARSGSVRGLDQSHRTRR